MKLTKEQELVVETNENLKINAKAGTGKTTTLYHYIKSRPKNSKILYIAFNKSVQFEAQRKFEDIDHVFLDIRTAHSMAYSAIIKNSKYKVGFLNPEDVSELLSIRDYVMCTHVVKMVNYFCGCSDTKLQTIDYRGTIQTQKALTYVDEHYEEIALNARKILAKMDKGEIPVIHDFYLKKWQLQREVMNYDYILFDEGQDASEAMLDIFNNQKGIKIIVGDSHQQIYAWRNAVNSLEKVDFKELHLSESFRFNQNIADMAVNTIKWKTSLLSKTDLLDFSITGSGNSKTKKTKAIIGRTNTKLVREAINMLVINKTITKPYFEGGFANYSINNIFTVAGDIIAIMNGRANKIKTAKLKGINSVEKLESFIEETEDSNLAQALEMVKEYGSKLIPFVTLLKQAIVEDKEDAEIIFTTVHKSKGMEYDEVTLLDDFNTKDKLFKMLLNSDPLFRSNALKSINEEINLIYVGLTRTKGKIKLSDSILKDILPKEAQTFEPKTKTKKKNGK
jgi:F-box protein 18 (helicase)